MKRLRRHLPEIAIGVVRFCCYLCLFALFFGLMSIYNWPLRHINRTLATTLLTWFSLTVLMHNVYGGLDVGRRKNKPVISSMFLGACMTDIITFIQLQIMNVNVANKAHLTLFGPDFPLLLLCMALQFAAIVFFVRIGNDMFFRMHPPRSALLVLGRLEQKDAVLSKINRYRLQWNVNAVTVDSDPALNDMIRDAEVVFLADLGADSQMNIIKTCYALRKEVICSAQLEEILVSSARQIIVDDAPFLDLEYQRITLGQRILKRMIDIVMSLAVLILLSPLLAVIALLIKLEDGGPVIFRQKRLTINGREFNICKFRTMSVTSSEEKHQESAKVGDKRITRTGKWLRRTRLDELPQFWNILKGEMSVVGPRPEMLQNIAQYKAELPVFSYREKMKAGLTGYAQIEGRYNTTPEDKLMLDLMYIESFSVWLDIKLIFRTLTVLFKSDSTAGFGNQEKN